MKELFTDIVSVVKQNGRRYDNIRASVQRDRIFIDDAHIPVEEGDFYERTLPNGIVERYKVLDAGFTSGMGGAGEIPDHYQSVVRKETKLDPPRQPAHVVYNLIGPNSRVNLGAHDSSVNVVSVEADGLFDAIRGALSAELSERDAEPLLAKLDQMKRADGQPALLRSYQEFIALAANHMTILAPFMPALSQLLG